MNITKMIVSTKIQNNYHLINKIEEDEFFLKRNKIKILEDDDLSTTDKIWLPTLREVKDTEKNERLKAATDFAVINNLDQIYNSNFGGMNFFKEIENLNPDLGVNYSTNTYVEPMIGTNTVDYWTRDSEDCDSVDIISGNVYEKAFKGWVIENSFGIVPALAIDAQTLISEIIKSNDDFIFHKKANQSEKHFLKIGEYPQTRVNNELNELLETLYNDGNLKEDLVCTGRLFTTNGEFKKERDFLSKQNPEFIYNGKRYVRAITHYYKSLEEEGLNINNAANDEVCWFEVEPLSFEIKNYGKLPPQINPNGKTENSDKEVVLEAERAVLSGLPFYKSITALNCNLWQNSLIRCFLNSAKRDTLDGNEKYNIQESWDFSNSGFLYQAFDLSRDATKEYIVPFNEKGLAENAFAGCVGIEKIIVHSEIASVGKNAFSGCKFNYAYKLKGDENLVFSRELPKEETSIVYDLKNISKALSGFDYSFIVKLANKNLQLMNSFSSMFNSFDKLQKSFLHLVDVLNYQNISLPFIFVEKLMSFGLLEHFEKNCDVRFLKSEDDIDLTKRKNYNNLSAKTKLNYYKFMYVLGCFSREKLLDKNGVETQILIAQKATSVLSQILKSKAITISEFDSIFDKLSFDTKPNQDFLKFISIQGKNKKLVNFELLLKLNKAYPGLFIEVMTNFDKAKSFRKTLDENGLPKTLQWDETFKRFFFQKRFNYVSQGNQDIAEIFANNGLDYKHFNETVFLRNKAKLNKVKEHILKKPLKEKVMLENIENIKEQTRNIISESKGLIDDLYAKYFTYEMLSKFDPCNSIIGLYTSCCATIKNTLYGADIAAATVIAKDVQNIVVRNGKGDIIAKGAMYVNIRKGYAVINDFELNQNYRKNEIERSGKYYTETESQKKSEYEREQIFETFMRGINAFVEEWDKSHPKNPIKQVNVGNGYNRLKLQCERFEKAKSSQLLKVPLSYCFEDAEFEQFILYKRKEKESSYEDNHKANKNFEID